MTEDAVNVVRIQETEGAIDALARALTLWLQRHEDRDVRGQFKTLFSTLRTQLLALIAEVRLAMKRVSAADSRGAVYAACRLNDKRLLWIERLWGYFRDKFDQREDPRYSGLLEAADEVVWSCYAEPFRASKRAHGTAPLPFVAAEYSPRAIVRSDVPQDLRSDVDGAFLARMLRELPVPVVSLPPQCVREPWWLIYLAHEVGHHVQSDLLPKQQLIDDFRGLVKATIPDEESADRWQYWGEEIFADVFSIYMTGPWALWALTELEWTTEAAMLEEGNARYPAPAARLILMSKVLDRLGFDGMAARRHFPEAGALGNAPEETVVTAVAEAVTTCPLIDAKTFGGICAWNLSDHKGKNAAVTEWRETFLRDGSRQADQSLSAARLALAGGVAAWAETSLETDAGRRETIKKTLAPALLEALRESHEPMERAAAAQATAAATTSRPLVSLLFDADPGRLGAW